MVSLGSSDLLWSASAQRAHLESPPSSTKPSNELPARSGRVLPQSAFPDDSYTPTLGMKRLNSHSVSFAVSDQLRGPEIRPGGRKLGEAAVGVVVPEASVHKYDCIPLRQDDVGFALQGRAVQSIPKSRIPKRSPDLEFRSCVLATNA
jgi:hypothetical protein